MAFVIHFRCSSCGHEMDLDVENPKVKRIVCTNPSCGHYADLPDESIKEELVADGKLEKILNLSSLILVLALVAGAVIYAMSWWPDANGSYPTNPSNTTFTGTGMAIFSAVGLAIISYKLKYLDTTCVF